MTLYNIAEKSARGFLIFFKKFVQLSMIGDTFPKKIKFAADFSCQGGAVEIFSQKILPSTLTKHQ